MTRKVNVRGQRKATKAAPAKKAGVIFTPEKGAPYKALQKDHAVFAAYTIAVMGCTGMLRVNKASVSSTGAGDTKAFAKATGSAKANWKKNGWMTEDGLTQAGFEKVQGRLADGSTDSYATNMALVNQVLPLVQKGGKLSLKDDNGKVTAFPFDVAVEVA